MPEEVIISFCAGCGMLCQPEQERCGNCNHNNLPREGRIEGIFSWEEARKLQELYSDV